MSVSAAPAMEERLDHTPWLPPEAPLEMPVQDLRHGRLANPVLPSTPPRMGLRRAAVFGGTALLGLTGVSCTSCRATRSCWPVSCSRTRTLRTKGEAGEWNRVMVLMEPPRRLWLCSGWPPEPRRAMPRVYATKV